MAGKHKTKMAASCENCGAEYWARAWYIRKGIQRFCSKTCSQTGKFNGNYRGGTAASQRTKRAIRKYPERHRCRRLFVKAVRKGQIERRPCCICNAPLADGHH